MLLEDAEVLLRYSGVGFIDDRERPDLPEAEAYRQGRAEEAQRQRTVFAHPAVKDQPAQERWALDLVVKTITNKTGAGNFVGFNGSPPAFGEKLSSMKIRPIRLACETDDVPARRAAAEALFLRVLAREARGSPKPTHQPAPATARAQGQAAGAAFAQISRADSDQAASYARAIQRGVQEAEREDDEAREIARNAGALRELGFPCRDAEDDHDF